MLFSSWLRNWKCSEPPARRRTKSPSRRPAGFRPRLEVLEERWVPSGYQQTNLVSYQPGIGHFTDPNLNGWGMTSMPDGSFVVANAFTTGLATFYDRSGHVLPQTISVPVEAQESAFLSAALGVSISTQYGHPTGVVYNPTNDFWITNPATGVRAPATLIFDSIDGTISGWNPVVDPTHAILIRDTWAAGTPAVYTGLEIGQDSHGNNVLYAADFLNNQLEVINGSFTTISTTNCAGLGVASDPYSWVWSVQAVNDKLYVTFADLLNPAGGGGGAVDVFDTDGSFQYQLDANGPGPQGRLQNPWGITQAPANFGAFSNDLLVGNVAGAGNINAYDPNTHEWLGQLRSPNGTPIAIKGLWDLEFGDGTPHGGKTNQLFIDAGPNKPGDSTGGLFGVIHAAGDQGGNGHGMQQTLTRQQLQPVVQQALADWQSAGATAGQMAQLRQVQVSIQALPASYQGEEAGNQVWISANAAGWGRSIGASTPAVRMNLRSVLDHEFGHVLGLEDIDNLVRDQVFADLQGT